MMTNLNSRELLAATAAWLGDQSEDLSFGLRSAFDGLRLYEYWRTHPELPEFCDEEADDAEVSVTDHIFRAIGYDPFDEPATVDAPVGAEPVIVALSHAEQILDSVPFVSVEGDTDRPLKLIRAILN